MIAADRVVAVLLAAGGSQRFGDADKLAAPLDGIPLATHAAATLSKMGFARLIAVIHQPLDLPGFETVINPNPWYGQSSSLKLGVEAALTSTPEAILIALADMPRITASHLAALLTAFRPGAVIASAGGKVPSPPALFAIEHAPALLALTGDHGARALLASAILVQSNSDSLADVDTPADLARLAQDPR